MNYVDMFHEYCVRTFVLKPHINVCIQYCLIHRTNIKSMLVKSNNSRFHMNERSCSENMWLYAAKEKDILLLEI